MRELREEVDAIRLSPVDTVATMLRAVAKGERIRVQCGEATETVEAHEAVPLCHKISVAAMRPGEPVRKYGEVIGTATVAIPLGTHVHVHNMVSGKAKRSA